MFVITTNNNSQSKLNCSLGTSESVTKQYTSDEVTPEEDKKRALELASSEANNQVVGVKISEETFRNVSETMKGSKSEDYFDKFSQLSHSTDLEQQKHIRKWNRKYKNMNSRSRSLSN